MPDYLVPLGRTFGVGANGAVSNLSTFPAGPISLRNALRDGDFDVVHVHEPAAPTVGWDACSWREAPVVGTFHAYSTKAFPEPRRDAARRAPQVQPALGPDRGLRRPPPGPRGAGSAASTRSSPTGSTSRTRRRGRRPRATNSASLFVGRAEERKGLPVLLNAFEALVEHVPAQLTVVGADADEVASFLPDPEMAQHIDTVGKISDAQLWREFGEADVVCAPSLAGESFGMVLIEAFASGTPVIASQIAGYSDVVSDGVDGILVPPADAQRLAEELQRARLRARAPRGDGRRRPREGQALRLAARRRSGRRGLRAGDRGAGSDRRRRARAPHRPGFVRADGGPRRPAAAAALARSRARDPGGQARPRVAPPDRARRRRDRSAIGLTSLAAQKIGVDNVVDSIVRSDVTWVLIAFALMCALALLPRRLLVWIARAALPNRPVRRRDVTSATMIGVLMSATLPARLGEPARAMVARAPHRAACARPSRCCSARSSRRRCSTSSPWSLLGVIIVSTTDLFHSSTQKLFVFSFVPLLLLVVVLLAPLAHALAAATGASPALGAAARGALLQVRAGPRRLHAARAAAPSPPRPSSAPGRCSSRLLGAALRARARRPGRDRRRRRGPLRRQRHRRRAGDARRTSASSSSP